jgi:benzodiazapine receptor
MTSRGSTLLRWSNVLAFVLTVVVNGLAGSTTFLGGKVTADISNANPTLITPSGYVFAIWGVIYVLLGAFVIYQALPSVREKLFQERIGWLFALSSALNILWLFAWQYEFLSLSVVIMFLLLLTLILIYIRLDIGNRIVERRERLAVQLPFSVYLGWITIATIADVSATLVSLRWDGLGIGPETWAIVIILIALVIAILMAVRRRDVAYELVIIWAFIGIAVNQSSNQSIAIVISVCVIAILVALVSSIFLVKRRRVTGSIS